LISTAPGGLAHFERELCSLPFRAVFDLVKVTDPVAIKIQSI
jgi:hypothetical protein